MRLCLSNLNKLDIEFIQIFFLERNCTVYENTNCVAGAVIIINNKTEY